MGDNGECGGGADGWINQKTATYQDAIHKVMDGIADEVHLCHWTNVILHIGKILAVVMPPTDDFFQDKKNKHAYQGQ